MEELNNKLEITRNTSEKARRIAETRLMLNASLTSVHTTKAFLIDAGVNEEGPIVCNVNSAKASLEAALEEHLTVYRGVS